MRFFGRWPLVGGAALLLACGCASGPSSPPFVSGSDHPERGIEVELVAEKPLPWGQTRSPEATDEVETEAPPATTSSTNWLSNLFGKKSPEKPKKSMKTGRTTRRNSPRVTTELDDSTRDYLEREMRDATPAERDALYRELQTQDPQMVRQIIKTWKMGRILRQQQVAEAPPTDASYPAEGARTRSSGEPQRTSGYDGYPATRETTSTHASSRFANEDPLNRPGNLEDGRSAPRLNRMRDGNVSPAQYTDNRESYLPPGGARNRTGDARSTLRSADYSGATQSSTNQYGQQGGDSVSGTTRSWSLAPGQAGAPQANTPYNLRKPDSQFRNYGASRGLPANGYPSPRTPRNANSVRYAGEERNSRPNPVQLPTNPNFNADPADQYPQGQDSPLQGQGTAGSQQGDPGRNLGSLVPGQFQQGRNFLDSSRGPRWNPPGGFSGQPASGMQNQNHDGGVGSVTEEGNAQLPNWGQGNGFQQPGNNLPPSTAPYGTGVAGQFAPNQFSSGQLAASPFSNIQQNSNQAGSGPQGAGQLLSGQYNSIQRAGWQTSLQQVVAAAEVQTAGLKVGTTDPERQAYIESHVYLRMLYLMSGQQERALQAIPGLDPADQEFWQQTFWGVSNYFDSRGIPRSSDRASQAVAQLTSAVQQLQAKANLELRNVSFCQKIASFGSYERFSREEFTPGQPVLLYAEVQNFRSEPTAAGQYRTVLKSVVEFYKPGANAELLDRIEFNPTEDVCRNFRRDYFHSYEFAIPAKLSLGPHVMKLTVEDQLSHRVASYTLNFNVH